MHLALGLVISLVAVAGSADPPSPKQAKNLSATLVGSDGIISLLKRPVGAGMLCYFTDNTMSKCWSSDKKTGKLVDIGGWQT